MKTIVVGLIAALIVYLVFRKIYKDFSKSISIKSIYVEQIVVVVVQKLLVIFQKMKINNYKYWFC